MKQVNTIYLVRHGENLANITKEFSYKLVDYSLTPKGIQQAEQTATYFKGLQIDEIYSSPLKRAYETADIIARELDLPVTIMEQFREVNVGDLEGQPPTEANWAAHNRIVEDWNNGHPETSFKGGENFLMLLQRVREALLEITHSQNGKRILIVAHGGIITGTVRGLCSGADKEALRVQGNHNCSITEIELHTSDDHVRGVLQSWAACTHLSGEAAQLVPAVPQFK